MLLSPLFLLTHFYRWTFLCCCGAVFLAAGKFIGDLSTWQVGKVTTMGQSTCTLFPPLQDRVIFRLLLFPSSFCGSTNSIFKQSHFYRWTFHCCCVVQCFGMLMPSMVISLRGSLETWRPCSKVREAHNICSGVIKILNRIHNHIIIVIHISVIVSIIIWMGMRPVPPTPEKEYKWSRNGNRQGLAANIILPILRLVVVVVVVVVVLYLLLH